MIRFNPINYIPKVNFKASQALPPQNAPIHKLESDKFELSIGYVNDIHGQTNNQLRIISGIQGDIRLSAGDDQIGNQQNHSINKTTVDFLKAANITARALGNHEMDTTVQDFCELNKGHQTQVLAINFRESENAKNKTEFNQIKKNSFITEVKGEKIGIIGACPDDIKDRIISPEDLADCEVDDYATTLEKIKQEAERLKAQGINKIFLLSHLGHDKNKDLAQKINGIDVIIGGHTHELLKDIKEGENLLYSPNGEPVIITQAGKDGHHFGLLNLEFNQNGTITKAQNNIQLTRNYPKNYVYEYLSNQILGPAEIVGEVKSVVEPPENNLINENAHANFICDAMKEATNADIGIWNNAGIRNVFHVGKINNREVKDIAPFADDMTVVPMSEKELVDTFNLVINRTFSTEGNKPGLYAVSGLTYTVNKTTKSLAAMNFVDKQGNIIPIDINNPNPNKIFKVAADKFITSGGDNNPIFNKIKDAYEILPISKNVMVCEYLKQQKEPIEINQTGRITIIE